MSTDFTSALKESDLVFWSRQLSEHALFLHLGLEIEPFKSLGLRLHNQWEDFRSTFPDIYFTGDYNTISTFNSLLAELKQYKLAVLQKLTRLQQNTDSNPMGWLGWINQSFAAHIIRELNYAHAKVNGQEVSITDEVNFWSIINKEHALFAAQLLDPSEYELIRIAQTVAEKLEQDCSCESCLFVNISVKYAKELDKFNRDGKALMDKNQLRSVIHPVLLTHVIREGQRSILILQHINQEVSTASHPEDSDARVSRRRRVFDDFSEIEENKNGKVAKSIYKCRH